LRVFVFKGWIYNHCTLHFYKNEIKEWIMALVEKVLERMGCPLHYWEDGEKDQPLVVLLHGACVDHHSFDLILPVIAEKYHVVTMDNRGHGLSQPMGEAYTTALAVEDTLAVLQAVGCEKAVFIGHSNGTYIAQELAFRYPERVLSLVLLDGTCITWVRSAFEKWLVDTSPVWFKVWPYENLKKTSAKMMANKQEGKDYIYRAYSQLSKENFITLWGGVVRCLHAEPDYNIRQSLLLMHGDNDTAGDIKKISPLWAAKTPGCQYVVIPNAGHMAVLDNPDFINAKILEFLQKTIQAE
jgi:3-oxoadipate enol-lactonase